MGCRGGASLEALAREFPGARVVGVDVVPEFVEVALDKGLDARVEDAHKLPFADGEFDWVVCNGTFEHFYNVGKAARELGRVARCGVYVTCDVREAPLGSDYAHASDVGAWREVMKNTGMEVVSEVVKHPGVEFVLVRR